MLRLARVAAQDQSRTAAQAAITAQEEGILLLRLSDLLELAYSAPRAALLAHQHANTSCQHSCAMVE
jgi:hypothetical protein